MPDKMHDPTSLRATVDPTKVLPESQLLAAKQRAWDGIYVGYALFPPGEFALPPMRGHLITVHLGSPVTTVRKRDGLVCEGMKVRGDIEIVSPGCPSYWAYQSVDEAIGIILAPELMQQVAAQAADISPERVEIPNNFGTRDPLIEHIGLALLADLKADNSDGRLFAESAAHLLAVHLLRTYAAGTHAVPAYSGGLPKHKLRRVIEFIDAHLENDLTLAELATAAGLSAYHFARLFKQSMGLTPHQYVLKRRIDAAKTLLTQTELSIATIASRVGFASQSHFATHFRHRTGVTPKAYRDMR